MPTWGPLADIWLLQLQRARVNARNIDSMDRDMKERNLEMLNSITSFKAPGPKIQGQGQSDAHADIENQS